MAEPQASPISQILQSLGITRESLVQRTDDMRHFLNADTSLPRVGEASNVHSTPAVVDNRAASKPLSARGSFTRPRSRASSNAFREASAPNTPVKSEPIEGTIPGSLRQFGSMEMVIERQRRQSRKDKKERRERGRDAQTSSAMPYAPSPSPGATSQSGFNLDFLMNSRVDSPATTGESQETVATTSSQGDSTSVVPVTPQRSKYYRDHTNLSSNTYSQPRKTPVKSESPAASHVPLSIQAAPASQPHYFSYPQYLAYARLLPPLTLPSAQAGPSMLPVTPQNQRTYTLSAKVEHSPLPPSSPPPATSPVVTPQRPLVNIVSSPGPMGPLPEEEEYDKLPYTLPPGPYSPHKPDASYAALVGQAILSSPKHRLTLQEIYDWITIVYPHFKRGETTWMNSIRHVLSTTVCFRKVPRERSIGRTLWAIWDEDLECFKGGGFRKHLCKDIAQSLAAKEGSRNKGKGRKRSDTDDNADTRKPKRAKKEPIAMSAGHLATSYMPATMSGHPLFPPTRPMTHHQPYYESCMQPRTLPAEVIFPPLPAGVGYNRLLASVSNAEPTKTDTERTPHPKPDQEQEESGSDSAEASPDSTPIAPSAPSSSDTSPLPDLTPNRSSSSPPPESSDLGTATSGIDDVNLDDYITIGEDSDGDDEAPGEDEENVFTQSVLSPVKFWGTSPKAADKSKAPEYTLGAGIKLEFGGIRSSNDDHQALWMRSKASPEGRKLNKKISFPPIPASPTLNRKGSSHLAKVVKPYTVGRKSLDGERPTTPTPSTPPRSARQLPVSSVRTPLSSKGINPAALYSEGDDDEDHRAMELDLNRTPRKRVLSSGALGGAPMTPRRLVFPTNQNDSPFSTPVGGGSVFSPFRTPGSRSVFDPHDPGTLLDEELNRMGAGDSPAGLFGKGRGSLLMLDGGNTACKIERDDLDMIMTI
ncbi:hypothetical protein H0H87_003529 [Tephrocybe sp. NHM501043]|nr:hypothetical protein H0H87_003529 [Tephrocybe sp. NHM501043]